MQDLDSLVNSMLNDMKEKKKRKRRLNNLTKQEIAFNKLQSLILNGPGSGTTRNPWGKPTLTLIMTSTKCNSCGNKGVSWEPHVYLTKTRTVRGNPESFTEVLREHYTSDRFQNADREIKVIHKTTPACPHCFVIEGVFESDGFGGKQLPLPLKGAFH